ncbi:MAG: cobyric acid synthase [Acidimicrobiales bacterium]
MIQGVSSDAGKSLVTAALCRWLSRQGVRVAPFKAQNMSNNARVCAGGEIGVAQWLQARAAGVVPDVRMNPVLLKPESDTRCQVVVNGVADHQLTRAPWRGRAEHLWPHVQAAFASLRADYEVIVIEGAGSPAETNLWADDIVNMAVADLAEAAVLLVADIDRGGAFAHLYGTWALLPERWQRRVEGFLLNKFRGDATLLQPAPATLEAATGVPTVGVLPMLDHGLPDEEGPTLGMARHRGRRVVVLCGPYASNLDEFTSLQQVADVSFATSPADLADLAGADLVVLPGSKHAAGDLAWLRRRGLDRALVSAGGSGVAVLGICGGLQVLGHRLDDPAGVEGSATGLGLLGVDTAYGTAKRTTSVTATFDTLGPPWQWLSGRTVPGYEIRLGTSEPLAVGGAPGVLPGGLGFATGNVLGVYLHGLFEDPGVLEAFTGRRAPALDDVFEHLADAVEAHFDLAWLHARTTGP